MFTYDFPRSKVVWVTICKGSKNFNPAEVAGKIFWIDVHSAVCIRTMHNKAMHQQGAIDRLGYKQPTLPSTEGYTFFEFPMFRELASIFNIGFLIAHTPRIALNCAGTFITNFRTAQICNCEHPNSENLHGSLKHQISSICF